MDWLYRIDAGILLFIQEHLRIEVLNDFWRFITSLGNAGWFWIVMAIILLCMKKTRTTGWMALLSLALGALITNVFLKNIVGRVRPFQNIDSLILLIPEPIDSSFPSGHTCAAFACSLIFYRRLPKKYGIPFVILAVLIAFSRLYLGAHYPSDVLAGFLIGCLSSNIVYYGYRYVKKR